MWTNRREVNRNPSEDELREMLFGRKVIKVNPDTGTLTLDDGRVLEVGGNEGCGGCPNGEYSLTTLNTVDNAITNVRINMEDTAGQYDVFTSYQIFVIAEDHNEHLLAQFDGTDGNGYYGTGWWISVLNT